MIIVIASALCETTQTIPIEVTVKVVGESRSTASTHYVAWDALESAATRYVDQCLLLPKPDRYCHHDRFFRAQRTAIPARGDPRWRPVLYRASDGWRLAKHTHHVVAGL